MSPDAEGTSAQSLKKRLIALLLLSGHDDVVLEFIASVPEGRQEKLRRLAHVWTQTGRCSKQALKDITGVEVPFEEFKRAVELQRHNNTIVFQDFKIQQMEEASKLPGDDMPDLVRDFVEHHTDLGGDQRGADMRMQTTNGSRVHAALNPHRAVQAVAGALRMTTEALQEKVSKLALRMSMEELYDAVGAPTIPRTDKFGTSENPATTKLGGHAYGLLPACLRHYDLAWWKRKGQIHINTTWQQETRLVSEHCSACVLCLWRADRSFEDHVLLLGDVAAFMNGMGYRVEHQVFLIKGLISVRQNLHLQCGPRPVMEGSALEQFRKSIQSIRRAQQLPESDAASDLEEAPAREDDMHPEAV